MGQTWQVWNFELYDHDSEFDYSSNGKNYTTWRPYINITRLWTENNVTWKVITCSKMLFIIILSYQIQERVESETI